MRFVKNPHFWHLWKEGRYQEALRQPVDMSPSDRRERLRQFFFGNREERQQTFAVAGISVGEFLYDYIRIDPRVVEGIDFSRSEDLDSIFAFSHFAKQVDPDSVGEIAQMQGYVAERMVAAALTAKGHDVEFPDMPNQKGWDLLVDGQPFQVKNLADPQGVWEHLERYPDIPVYVNEELAPYFEGHATVYAVEGLSHDQIVGMTKETLALGADLQDFEIPWIAAMISVTKNVKSLISNEKSWQETVLHVGSDTVSRSLAGWIGQKAGTVAGLFLFGPAGGVIIGGLGAFLGMGQGGKLSAKVKTMLHQGEILRFQQTVLRLIQRTEEGMASKREIKARKWQQMERRLKESAIGRLLLQHFRERYHEELTYLSNRERELQRYREEMVAQPERSLILYPEILASIFKSGVHPIRMQNELAQTGKMLDQLLTKLN